VIIQPDTPLFFNSLNTTLGYNSKVVSDHATYAKKFSKPTRFNRKAGGMIENTQQGKFITIYPSSDSEAKAIAKAMDEILSGNGFNRPNQFLRIPGEKPIGSSGAVYARYGQFFEGGQAGLFKTDAHGYLLNRAGKQVNYQGRPLRADALTDADSPAFHFAKEHGDIVPDIRGSDGPSWAPKID
jgi:hypothetical protein